MSYHTSPAVGRHVAVAQNSTCGSVLLLHWRSRAVPCVSYCVFVAAAGTTLSALFSHPPTQIHRSESKLTSLKERLATEIDAAATTLPTIVADSLDHEAVGRMVSQAKVRKN